MAGGVRRGRVRSGLPRACSPLTPCFPYGAPCDLKEPGEVDAFIHLPPWAGWELENGDEEESCPPEPHSPYQEEGLAGTGARR